VPAEQKNYGAVAQLGERNAGSVEVVGSIPSGSTKIFYGLALFMLSYFFILGLERKRLNKKLAFSQL
jgi:hypothetical protein